MYGYTSNESNSVIFNAASLQWGQVLQERMCSFSSNSFPLTLLHSEHPKLYGVLAIPSAKGLRVPRSLIRKVLRDFIFLRRKQEVTENVSIRRNGEKRMKLYPYCSLPSLAFFPGSRCNWSFTKALLKLILKFRTVI